LYGAGLHARKKWDKLHETAETLIGDGSFEEHYTFSPKILKKSRNIKNISNFYDRLYNDNNKRKTKLEKNEKLRDKLLTFQPTIIRKKKVKSKHYHAQVGVNVPINNFGLPDGASETTSKTSNTNTNSNNLEQINWYCKRKPVPSTPIIYSIEMYKLGMKKMKEKDDKFLKQKMNKDWSSCTFTPKINSPSLRIQKQSKPQLPQTTQSDDTINLVNTKDFGCMVGESILSITKTSATSIQRIGRGKSKRNKFKEKRKSSIKIQKMVRGKSGRNKYKKKINALKIEKEKKEKTEDEIQKENNLRKKELAQIEKEEERKREVVNTNTNDIVTAGKKLQKEHIKQKEQKEQKKTKAKGKKKQVAKKKSKKKSKKNSTPETNNPKKQGVIDLHEMIGLVYGNAVAYHRKVLKDNSEEMTFINWYKNIYVLKNICNNDDVLRDKYITDVKIQYKKYYNESNRILWFGAMLGWLPKVEEYKNFPFTNNLSTAFIEVLNTSGIVSIYEYENKNNAMIFTKPLLCKTPSICNDHALTQSIIQFFETSGNNKDKEVLELIENLKKGSTNGQVDLYNSMHLFIVCWYSIIGRFKTMWEDENDVPPSSPKEKIITPG
jgi:hypothetical protein